MSEEQSAYSFLALILPLEWARGPDSTLDPNPWYAFQGEIGFVRSGVKHHKIMKILQNLYFFLLAMWESNNY